MFSEADHAIAQVGDVVEILRLICLAPLAWLLPERLWDLPAGAVGVVMARLRYERSRTMARHVAAMIGDRATISADRVIPQRIGASYLDRMQILRCWRPGGWHPAVRLHGRDNLESALRSGKGAILWVTNSVYAGTVSKLSLHGAGFQVSHLSYQRHGFSQTDLGQLLLNPIRLRIEDRYLRERISVTKETAVVAARRLSSRLREGGIVSITVTGWGRRTVEAPFLAGRLRVANGAPALAVETGAPLLPLFVDRAEDGAFKVTIEPPIRADGRARRDAAIDELVRGYARALASHVLAHPEQWQGWESLGQPPADGTAP